MTPSLDELESWLVQALLIAKDAGAILADSYRKDVEITMKGSIDLVTSADLASEKLIRDRMKEAFPTHQVIAEEGAKTEAQNSYVWYCDPLDGTTNFAHGHPFFAVSLGLVKDGVPLLGVVHAPRLGLTFSGALGLGTFRYENGVKVRTKMGRAPTLREALIATGFPYDRRTSEENNVREFSRIVLEVRGIRRCGSAALDLALVADGVYDGYWEQKLAPWDLAAGAALVGAAGGLVTGYEGEPLDIKSGRLVAGHAAIHRALLVEIAAARSDS